PGGLPRRCEVRPEQGDPTLPLLIVEPEAPQGDTRTRRTTGNPDASSVQDDPASRDPNSRPSDVPNAANEPSESASKHMLSMWSSNHSGRPSRHRSNPPPPSVPR